MRVRVVVGAFPQRRKRTRKRREVTYMDFPTL